MKLDRLNLFIQSRDQTRVSLAEPDPLGMLDARLCKRLGVVGFASDSTRPTIKGLGVCTNARLVRDSTTRSRFFLKPMVSLDLEFINDRHD